MLELKKSSIKDNAIRRYFFVPHFKRNMVGIRFKSHQIFRTIIAPIFIKMMTIFRRFEKSSYIFFNYKPMFSDISSMITKRMTWFVNHYVSILFMAPTFPANRQHSFFAFHSFADLPFMFRRKRVSFFPIMNFAHFPFSFFRVSISFSRFNSFFNCFFRLFSTSQPFSRIFPEAFLFCNQTHFSPSFFRAFSAFHPRCFSFKGFGKFFSGFFSMMLPFYPRNITFFKLSIIHNRRFYYFT